MKNIMALKQILRAAFSIVILSTLCGCVAGQAVRLRHEPSKIDGFTSQKEVSADVTDSREFIVNGEKDPSYLGYLRAGFGNTWGVKNAGNKALAEQFESDLAAELSAQGIKVVDKGTRRISVDIKNWKFDAYQNGKLEYDIDVKVTNTRDKELASMNLKDSKVIKGSFWMGPAGAMKRELPVLYSDIIKEIVDNADIQKALK